MNPFASPERIYVSLKPQDMRAGIQRLAEIVTTEFGRDPMDGALYVFVSRDCAKAKMIRFETSAWCLYYVRLLKGTFRWRHAGDSGEPVLAAERRQLLWLLEGLDFVQPQAARPVGAHGLI